jgi:hypothetical protein
MFDLPPFPKRAFTLQCNFEFLKSNVPAKYRENFTVFSVKYSQPIVSKVLATSIGKVGTRLAGAGQEG